MVGRCRCLYTDGVGSVGPSDLSFLFDVKPRAVVHCSLAMLLTPGYILSALWAFSFRAYLYRLFRSSESISHSLFRVFNLR